MEKILLEQAVTEQESRKKEKVIESLEFPNFRLNFVSLEDFEPEESNEKVLIPETVRKLIDSYKEFVCSSYTYKNTLKESGWKENLFNFVVEYLEDEGEMLQKKIKIEDLRDLSAKQIIELVLSMSLELTKYTYKKGEPYGQDADNHTVLELLEKGKENKDNPDWEGNGVCRNFACIVKALFESLKAGQLDKNKLYNLYCAYQSGSLYERTKDEGRYRHAWNSFLNLSVDDLKVSEVDVTWGKYDLETKEISRIDFTEARLDNMIDEFLRYGNPKEVKIGLRFFEEKMKQADTLMRDYYIWIISRGMEKERVRDVITGGDSKETKESLEFYQEKMKQSNKEIEDYYLEMITRIIKLKKDFNEFSPYLLEIIRNFCRNSENVQTILKKYRTAKGYDRLPPWRTIMIEDKRFVKVVLEEASKKENFVKYLDQNMKLRSVVRQFSPELLPRFNPKKDTGDFNELIHLLDKAVYFKRLLMRWLRSRQEIKKGSSLKKMISQEDIDEVFDFAKQNLREVNPELYDKKYSRLSNFKVVSEYNSLYEKLRDERKD